MARYKLFATEFYPNHGGIVEYTHCLALSLYNKDLLVELISFRNHGLSLNYNNKKLFLKNVENTNLKKTKKIYSLIYRITQWLYFYKEIAKIIFSKKNDIVIFNSLFIDLSWKGISILRFFKKKYSVIIHGLEIIDFSVENKKKQKLIKILKSSKFIIANSSATKNLLLDMQLTKNERKIKIIYPVLEKKEKIKKSDLEKEKIIVSICRLVKRKGIEFSIQAIANTFKNNSDWRYYIVGVGPEYANLQALVEKLEMSQQIVFLGFISNKKKHELLSKSSIFIMPNNTLGGKDWEGFGISFIEAQFYKNVVIGGKNGGVTESIWDKKSGYLIDFDYSPISQIENHLKFLINSESKRNSMGETGKKFVKNKFSLVNMEEQILDQL